MSDEIEKGALRLAASQAALTVAPPDTSECSGSDCTCCIACSGCGVQGGWRCTHTAAVKGQGD